jgi:hypothetical protein
VRGSEQRPLRSVTHQGAERSPLRVARARRPRHRSAAEPDRLRPRGLDRNATTVGVGAQTRRQPERVPRARPQRQPRRTAHGTATRTWGTRLGNILAL